MSSTRRRNADCEPLGDHITPASRVPFVTGDLTLLLIIQVRVRQLFSELYLSDVSGPEKPLQVPEVGDFDVYAADVDG